MVFSLCYRETMFYNLNQQVLYELFSLWMVLLSRNTVVWYYYLSTELSYWVEEHFCMDD